LISPQTANVDPELVMVTEALTKLAEPMRAGIIAIVKVANF
jgi:hypothetical protein